jgi:hypothetical protein
VPVGVIRAHRRNHRADQLVSELIGVAVAIQPGRYRRVGIAARVMPYRSLCRIGVLAVHPSR